MYFLGNKVRNLSIVWNLISLTVLVKKAYNENKYSHLRTLEDCLMHDYPNLMTIMRMRGKSRKDCAKAIGCNRTTLYKKLHGQADWRLQECLALRAYLCAVKVPLDVLFKRRDRTR